jgi:hypothetical protein
VSIAALRLVLMSALLASAASRAQADPWAAPGDATLRHDIQVLADAGVLRGPITSWPLSWPDILRDVKGLSPADVYPGISGSLVRVQRLARAASSQGFSGIGLRAAAAHEPTALRGFAESPREEGEAAAQASWLSDHVALNARVTVVADADDDKKVRPDGSYLGVNLGNFMVSAGYMERWWGPGWDGSLILSSNARPMPGITIERNYTDPFKTKLLSWIGPWRASIAVSQAESHDVAVAKVRFLAARVNFKPRPWLEFGLTRTAQWCGGDRPCGWRTFRDLLIGRDNVEADELDAQPGNQMAGYDMRLRSPWRRLPAVFYTQWIGEDEAGGLPSKFLGLFGLETWGAAGFGSWRARVEYADTACTFTRQEPDFDCGYRNAVYPQGYAYRGRIIGHPLDNDSRMVTFGAVLIRPAGDSFSAEVHRAEINRNGLGEPHAISPVPMDLDDIELRYSRTFGFGQLVFGAGLERQSGGLGDDSGVHGYVIWQQGF